MVRWSIRLALAPIALSCSACGGGSPAETTPASTTAVPEAPVTALTITTPANGAIAALQFAKSGARKPRLVVSGAAPAGTRVRVTVACAGDPCVTTVATSKAATWTAQVPLRLSAAQTTLSVSAENAAADSADPATVVLVQLGAEDVARASALETGSQTVKLPKRRKRGGGVPKVTVPPELLHSGGEVTTIRPGDPPLRGGSRATGPVYLIGDSLAEGVAPYLSGALGGTSVSADGFTGRPLAQGMRLVRQVPKGARLAVSLFTNDDPRAVAALESAVRESVAIVGSTGCAVWATIVRPPLNGVSYEAANQRLRQLETEPGLSERLHIVPWDQAVAANPGWMAGDRVHASAEGYRARAQMYAEALLGC